MAEPAEFHPLLIAHIARDQGDVTVVTFAVPPDTAARFRFKPGQHVAVRALIDGHEVRRNYSICAGPGEPLRIAIKQVANGQFSTWAHQALQAGQSLDVMPPAGRFVLADGGGSARHVVTFAAGSGITPVLGIIRQALEHDAHTWVTLVYGNRGRDTVLFAEELDELKDRHLGRFDIVSVFSRSGEVDVPLFEGRIGADKVRALGQRLIRYTDAAQIFICGPGSMIKETRDTLMALGVARERIVHEFFAAGGGAFRKPLEPASAAVAVPRDGPKVTVILDGVRTRLTLEPGEFVLQAALRAGVKAPYACAGGMCCTCRAKIVSGTASMTANYSLEQWEIDKGFVLTCQALPTSDALVIDWDAM
jgi:ring-1,2-phenylacetyl-CoA epoxidase subunit PaaE